MHQERIVIEQEAQLDQCRLDFVERDVLEDHHDIGIGQGEDLALEAPHQTVKGRQRRPHMMLAPVHRLQRRQADATGAAAMPVSLQLVDIVEQQGFGRGLRLRLQRAVAAGAGGWTHAGRALRCGARIGGGVSRR